MTDLYDELKSWGVVRLRLFEWLRQRPDLDMPEQIGKVVAHVAGGSVKAAFHEDPRPVKLGYDTPGRKRPEA